MIKAKPKSKVAETDSLRVVVEHHAALVGYAVILAMNVKAMEMGIAPAHSDLNGGVGSATLGR